MSSPIPSQICSINIFLCVCREMMAEGASSDLAWRGSSNGSGGDEGRGAVWYREGRVRGMMVARGGEGYDDGGAVKGWKTAGIPQKPAVFPKDCSIPQSLPYSACGKSLSYSPKACRIPPAEKACRIPPKPAVFRLRKSLSYSPKVCRIPPPEKPVVFPQSLPYSASGKACRIPQKPVVFPKSLLTSLRHPRDFYRA